MDRENLDSRQQRRLPAQPLRPSGSRMSPAYRILDISRSGCLVESREPLGRVASTLALELPVPTRADNPVARAKIVWERVGQERGGAPSFRYGLSFREMDGASHRALDLYLDYLKRDHHVTQLDQAWRKLRIPKTMSCPSLTCEEPEAPVPPISERPFTGLIDSENAFVR